MNIKEIAGLAGVSPATVSRVLNGSGYVKKDTKKRVMEAVEKHNYVPNAIARSLSVQESSEIGLVIPGLRGDFFADLAEGVLEEAAFCGQHVVIMKTDHRKDLEETALERLGEQRLKGIILVPGEEIEYETDCETGKETVSETKIPQRITELEKTGISVVLAGRTLKGIRMDRVCADEAEAVYEAAEELIKNGYEKLMLLGRKIKNPEEKEKVQAFYRAGEENRCDLKKNFLSFAVSGREEAEERTEAALKGKTPVRALIVTDPELGMGCIKALKKAGKEGEVPIVMPGDAEQLLTLELPVASIGLNGREQGREAVRLLLNRFENRETGCTIGKRVVVPCDLQFWKKKKPASV